MQTKRLLIGAFLVVAIARSLSAHHSFAAEFDVNKPVTLSGTVSRVEYIARLLRAIA